MTWIPLLAVTLILIRQIIAPVPVDRFGLIRAPVHETSLLRMVGALVISARVGQRF